MRLERVILACRSNRLGILVHAAIEGTGFIVLVHAYRQFARTLRCDGSTHLHKLASGIFEFTQLAS